MQYTKRQRWGRDCPNSRGLLISPRKMFKNTSPRTKSYKSWENHGSPKLWHLKNDECNLCICSLTGEKSHLNVNKTHQFVQLVIIRNILNLTIFRRGR